MGFSMVFVILQSGFAAYFILLDSFKRTITYEHMNEYQTKMYIFFVLLVL